ncbi:hypothetical protein BD626DRAFT_479184 [Schizophyllum amplum]|uniref:Uncharacterized protein n=1 Tax=Schizophyllum amplum TaxID=97359 RepID=A0A550CS18_9AGAR|nr:hypothetical protein BD626DRAFT_479184 [Auriculariopsis ampla]
MVIQFLSPLLPGLCLQPGGAMTLPLQYRLVSSGESSSRPPSPLSLWVPLHPSSIDDVEGGRKRIGRCSVLSLTCCAP